MRGIFGIYSENIKLPKNGKSIKAWDIAGITLKVMGIPIPDYMDTEIDLVVG